MAAPSATRRPQFPHRAVTWPWSCGPAGGRREGVSGGPPTEPWGQRPIRGSERGAAGGSKARPPPPPPASPAPLRDAAAQQGTSKGNCRPCPRGRPRVCAQGVCRVCALCVHHVHLASWGKAASDPDGPPRPEGQREGSPSYWALDPGKPLTALLGAVSQMGNRSAVPCPGPHGDGASVPTSLWRGETSPRAPAVPHPSFLLSAAVHPRGGGRTAVPSSRRGGSEGPSGPGRAGGVPPGAVRGGPWERPWVPPPPTHTCFSRFYRLC